MELNIAGATMVRINPASTPVQSSRLALQSFPWQIEHGRVPGAAR